MLGFNLGNNDKLNGFTDFMMYPFVWLMYFTFFAVIIFLLLALVWLGLDTIGWTDIHLNQRAWECSEIIPSSEVAVDKLPYSKVGNSYVTVDGQKGFVCSQYRRIR